MPAKNAIKTYIPDSYYHIYNRGVEKRNIFIDEQDYKVFLNYLKIYLSPKEKIIKKIRENKNKLSEKEIIERTISIIGLKNFCEEIELICFSLMPNHFHLALKQRKPNSIEFFMRSLLTKYVAYFNKKYSRVGPLFQGVYKARHIESDEYFLHLSRYIHLNPKKIIGEDKDLTSYRWSSYPAYLGKIYLDWLNKSFILNYFSKVNGFGFGSYEGFIEGYK